MSSNKLAVTNDRNSHSPENRWSHEASKVHITDAGGAVWTIAATQEGTGLVIRCIGDDRGRDAIEIRPTVSNCIRLEAVEPKA